MRAIELQEGSAEYSIKISDNLHEIKEDWNRVCRNSIYFNSDYLELLESYGPDGYTYYYAIVYLNGEAEGIYYFQKKTIELAKDFRVHTHSKNPLKKIGVFFQKQFFRMIRYELLVFGNVLLTGEYAYFFRNENPGKSEFNKLTNTVLRQVQEFIKANKGRKFKSVLSKDFYVDSALSHGPFPMNDFTEFQVQPDMILKIKPDWASFADYTASVKSKYRVKFKKVNSKGRDLEYRDLSPDDMASLKNDIHKLYLNTSQRASFSLFVLHDEYFLQLKKTFPDRFIATGVFLDDKLVAFYTLILNGENADAHFLGYNPALNSRYQIYFNILLKLIEKSISLNAKILNLSRTALEIKSSVGAEPFSMNIYLKINNNFLNNRLSWILKRTVPAVDWIQRRPFKE
ncbi:MAG: GNAT family N-acetyltransferase [Saprospiraceae bacterium]|nr:GNAT family N-acetyltransferase [Saprospiraceae bacterium]